MEKSNAENIINEIQSLIKALKDCGREYSVIVEALIDQIAKEMLEGEVCGNTK